MKQRNPLPEPIEYVPYIRRDDWLAGLTAQAMRVVAQQRRIGTGWTSINCGWLNVPRKQLVDAYNRLPGRFK